MPEQSDSSLFDSFIKEGNVDSLEELFNRHSSWMRAMLAASLDNPDDANDMFQEVWLKIIRKASLYRGGSVRAFFATLLRNQLYDRYREAGRHVFQSIDDKNCGEDDSKDDMDELSTSGNSPGDEFLANVSAGEIRLAVCSLPDDLRGVFLLRVEGDLKFREIAAELNQPVGTVLSKMRKAIQIMRRKLEGMYGKR